MTWEEICEHPALRDLLFRIESNRWGQIVMCPPHNDHGWAQESISDLLKKLMPNGRSRQETNITTGDGTKVADNVWMSEEFRLAHKGESTYRRAPEIVVELKSPGNSMPELPEKKELFLAAGAREVWVHKGSGEMLFYDQNGLRERSALRPEFPVRVEVD